MTIPFKFDSCKDFATNLNPVSSWIRTGFEKVFKTVHTCQQYIQYRVLIFIVFVNIKKELENYKEKKNMQKIGSIKTDKRT